MATLPAGRTTADDEAFDLERRSAITSTDAAALLGLSCFGSPLTVYRDKRGESEPWDVSLPAWMGTRLEDIVSELYVAATGTPVRRDEGFYRHPTLDWIGTHIDCRAVGDDALVVELKTRNSARGWGADGSADIPVDVWTQVQVQAAVLGAREVHVAALFSNSSFRVYRIEPDPFWFAKFVDLARVFWFEHVLAGVPPMATGTDADTEIVSRVGGGNTGVIKQATPEQEAIVGAYRLARLNAAQANFNFEGVKNRVKQIIGEDADGLRGSFGVIWWRRAKAYDVVEWDRVADVYRRAARRLLEMAAPGDDDALVAELAAIAGQVDVAESLYTRTEPGTRRLAPNLRDD